MTLKRLWSVWIKTVGIILVLVFVFGALFDHWTNEQPYRNPIEAGFFAILIYVACSTILLIIHRLADLIYLFVFGGSDMVDSALEQFRSMKLQAPAPHYPKTFKFLEELADDEAADANERVKAALLVGGFQAVIAKSGIFRSLAFEKAINEAVLRYSQEAPRANEF